MEEKMTQEEKSRRIQQAEEKLRQAKAQLAKAKREEREKTRKEENHQKYVLGGIVVKYFPEAYGFSEHEMSRIIACAFKNRDIQNMISTVVKERSGTNPAVTESGSRYVGGVNEKNEERRIPVGEDSDGES